MTLPLTLTMVNNSGKPGSLLVYQQANPTPDAIAWLSKYAYPGTNVQFSWDPTSWCFVWSGSGRLSPGVVFDVAQVVPASFTDASVVAFSYDGANRTFYFGTPHGGAPAGSLLIQQDSSIPVNGAAVGIGMDGKAVYLVESQPNISVAFTPRASYWVAFATKVQQGEYIDVTTMTVAEVVFPPNVYAMTATIDAQGDWTIEQNILQKVPEAES